MEIASSLECINHTGAIRHTCEKAELKLPVISNDQVVARRRLEGLTDFVGVLFKGRLILKVGRSGRQPAGLGVKIERAVNTLLIVGKCLEICNEVANLQQQGTKRRGGKA